MGAMATGASLHCCSEQAGKLVSIESNESGVAKG